MYKEEIEKIAQSIKDELIKIRRDIHSHPEIALNEFRTSKLVAEKLEELGMEVQVNIRVTGVVATLKGKYPGKTILMRADMDCLQLDELTNLEFKSQHPGYMHACGHDAHTTWLLGAAMILSHFKDRIHGNIKFLFQPAEESKGGAEEMIKAGVLENPHVDAAVGAHVWPAIESGKVGIKYGAMMAAPDNFRIVIHGKGGHGAVPNKCIDPISIANHIYSELQTIISRKLDPLEPVIITVGKFNAGTASNIIPDCAVMEGTVRTLSYSARDEVPKLMEKLVKGITEANGGKYEFQYNKCYPPVINENSITSFFEKSASKFLGSSNVEKLDKATMIGEDFSYFQQKVPGVFFAIGTMNKTKGIDQGLHSPYFTIDEDILTKASGLFSYFALDYLLN